MVYAEVGDGLVHVTDTGGDGPPIVLTHPLGHDLNDFAAQADDLHDVYRVVRWDRSGHGASDPATSPADVWTEARVLFRLLDLLGIERAMLLGVADGALLTVRAALLHPDRVRALLLVDLPTDLARDAELGPRLEELAMPALLVHGAMGTDHPAADQQVARRLGDARGVVAVPGAAAAAYRTHPDATNAALREFIEGLPA